jgi:hypothetical protein
MQMRGYLNNKYLERRVFPGYRISLHTKDSDFRHTVFFETEALANQRGGLHVLHGSGYTQVFSGFCR